LAADILADLIIGTLLKQSNHYEKFLLQKKDIIYHHQINTFGVSKDAWHTLVNP